MKTGIKLVSFIRSYFIILLLYIPAAAIDNNSASSVTENDTVFINEVSGPPDTSSDSLVRYIDYLTVNSRAKSMKLEVVEDSGPYIDNTALFLIHPRIECPVTGLTKGKNYSIYIDFVRYRGNEIPFGGILKIFIKDSYGNEQLIGSVDSSSLKSDKIFCREIPFNLSYSGSFTIIIQEYSMKTGNWGFWDIIVTSKNINEIGQIRSETAPQIKDSGTKIFN